MSCANCHCANCVRSRAIQAPAVTLGARDSECAYDRIAREYAARNVPMPTGWLLYCPCKRCNPICW